jgi:hypothetical protein
MLITGRLLRPHDLLQIIPVNVSVAEFVPELGSIDLNLLGLPSHQIPHVEQSARQVFGSSELLIHAHLPHGWISRPGTKRRLWSRLGCPSTPPVQAGKTHFVVLLVDVDKPSSFNACSLHAVLDDSHGPPQLLPSVGKESPELRHGRLFVDGPVVATEFCRRLVALDPASGLEGAVRFPEELVPVDDAPEEPADVDEVKCVFGECPALGAVVDLACGCVSMDERLRGAEGDEQGHVRRDPAGLDGGEVGAEDCGAGVLVAEIDRPEAGAGAYIEDLLDVVADGCLEKLAAEKEGQDVVAAQSQFLSLPTATSVIDCRVANMMSSASFIGSSLVPLPWISSERAPGIHAEAFGPYQYSELPWSLW